MNTPYNARSFLRQFWCASALAMSLVLSTAFAQTSPQSASPMPLDGALSGFLKRNGIDVQSRQQRTLELRKRGLGFGTMPIAQFDTDVRRKRASAGTGEGREASVTGLLVRFRSAQAQDAASENKPPSSSLISAVVAASGKPIEYTRPMSMGFFVFQFPIALSMTEAQAVRNRVEQIKEVEIADLNLVMHSTFVPNDPLLSQYQASLLPPSLLAGGIDAIGAWDYTVGSTNTVVAVIDTGVTNHPDFAGRILPGADLITASSASHDGSGRDLNATDSGDWQPASQATPACPKEASSWHGTHVTGIIAANGNNGVGIAGIDWRARIVPIRVLGRCGGDWSDILDGFLWAVGIAVPGLPVVNANPARIINMSLGGNYPGGCPRIAQLAIQEARARGASVIVAAGNSDTEVIEQVPASCKGVITVGAVDPYGMRASYSNYSSKNKVFVSAPGGDTSRYGTLNGIISTLNSGATVPDQPSYAFYQGTSMAAPHITGIASLALSANPNLNGVEIEALLQLTASPFPTNSVCEIYYPLCGVGIANAKGMVQGATALLPYKIVTEFYNIDTKHYFRTGDRDEPAIVETGKLGNWVNTEDFFVAWRDSSQGASPVCRFYSYKFNSHFYTVNPAECEFVKHNADWVFESIAFYAKVPFNGQCAPGTRPIYRFYNNRQDFGDGNHRFTPYGDFYGPTLIDQGWKYEGVAMCAVDA